MRKNNFEILFYSHMVGIEISTLIYSNFSSTNFFYIPPTNKYQDIKIGIYTCNYQVFFLLTVNFIFYTIQLFFDKKIVHIWSKK